ncbi:histidine ammonia-lyase [Alkaliphilus oremlandii]|uniref:Histidine ammonia-lyase n=1 Tax=Alkaliphilus oremlandii (strain OhILAs) TaxID=350688 RepID=HUTH_ALKOO|nr:histidine ammonia-lyase [Alkaliphilus oremlandii]A8MF64.1 RecName: Full=Histidine ammonia-lyase; Short=Histidase [Alkaliphilus oremlandii OhILAs]ABW18733.1 histidine ammonia-lyase [Alkaliphilus oremlandii OhILAs]
MKKIMIDGEQLTLQDIIHVTRNFYEIELSEDAKNRVRNNRKVVDRYVEEEKVVYGITTGFGKFSDVVISKSETEALQRNLIISHACGVGNPLEEDVVRGIMLLRANALSKGYSGIRLETLSTLIEMLNKGVHPVIPEKGSLGASGDLAPLSHMVLVLIGEGEAIYQGKRMSGREAMEAAGIRPVVLTSKEGLALINGTQVMTAIGALTVYDAINLSKISDIAAALTIEAQRGIVTAFDKRVHEVRPHAGQISCAENLNRLLEGSTYTTKQGEIKVQDAYTLRCIPQIHGASKDAIQYVENKINIEINSATDNPLIFSEDNDVISGGNFHGQPMALSFDFLGIALAEIANVSERRIERLVNPQLSGLPAFLTEKGGLNSGFMITQYSAAALVSENKVLAHPASVDSIPSSANQEDHVSMGTIAARKAREIYKNAVNVVAIELMAAAQGIDFYEGYTLGEGTQIAYDTIRNKVSKLQEDRVMYFDINQCANLIFSGELIEAVEKAVELQ